MIDPTVTYGIGGFDSGHPNGNVIRRVVYEAGKQITTTYGADGSTLEVTEEECPTPEPLPPTDAERIAALESTVDALLAIIEGA